MCNTELVMFISSKAWITGPAYAFCLFFLIVSASEVSSDVEHATTL